MKTLTEDNIKIIHINEFYRHVRFTSLDGGEIEWTDEEAHELKDKIIKNQENAKDLEVLGGGKYIAGIFIEYEKFKNIVDKIKKRIKTFTDYESKLTENEKMTLFELTEIMDGKNG